MKVFLNIRTNCSLHSQILEFLYVFIPLFKWLQVEELKNEIVLIPMNTQGLYVMTTSYVLDIF